MLKIFFEKMLQKNLTFSTGGWQAEIPSGIPKEEKEIRQGGKAICLNYRTSGIWHRNMLYQ